MQESLQKTFLVSITERFCPRLQDQFVLPFPIVSGPLDVVPLLVDLRNMEDMAHWKSVVIFHSLEYGKEIMTKAVYMGRKNEGTAHHRVEQATLAYSRYNVCSSLLGLLLRYVAAF